MTEPTLTDDKTNGPDPSNAIQSTRSRHCKGTRRNETEARSELQTFQCQGPSLAISNKPVDHPPDSQVSTKTTWTVQNTEQNIGRRISTRTTLTVENS